MLLAVAGILGAGALLSPLAAAAQASPSIHAHSGRHSAEERRDTVEQRIATLHTSLQITPSEETNWGAVAQVMRGNEAKMQALISARAAEPRHSMGAIENLRTYERFTRAHVDGLEALISSFETLYKTMPDSQKRIADGVLLKFGHPSRA
jgi:hypothetical protein